MSSTRLITPALAARLAAAGPSGKPQTLTRANTFFSSISHESRVSLANPHVYTTGGTTAPGARRCLTTTPASHLSTKRQLNGNTSSSNSNSNNISSSGQPAGGAPGSDEFSLKGLGMTRGVKIVVYTVVGVLGTMETVFWTKVLWRWWTNKGEEDESRG
ncbi:hypothetical protein F5X99DRAFT_411945 [Biscogniauxia marginata]|nr:hypothetical protein F5X99DRAFT_411945 [Biscogniauxia marginata]